MDTQPTWDWSTAQDGLNDASTTHQSSRPQQPADQPHPTGTRARSNRQRYGPRSCRICLETEHPQFPETFTTLGISSGSAKPVYKSDDPELGRLLSPCKCKGSQKYVHEGCLNAWRLANPGAARNFWQCPTCKFTYRMSRLSWATALSNKSTRIALTVAVLIIGLFVLGYIADPLFDLWFDPLGTLTDGVASVVTDIEGLNQPFAEAPQTWTEHFAKGFFSLGLVGLVKSMFAMSPWQWFYYRGGGMMGGRRQGTGRARAENMSWLFILIGAFTFLMATWRFVGAMSERLLKNVSERVMDVNDDDADDEADEHEKDE
ncbi:uncharacterized protein F5Z01DRAFT_741967 [Emericellopsis atlantica]|uniref:RING-CH-type domain-containing protein n=1 Tax=Emericellopsis atlantica TaxID=2614577 RepID=A0A9P8CTB0_9HYPO|nr:uncharacterized protein F5Z01DRAFT_741967 [Emericellopsis atlantica]KAG9256636.1 hypothetical protein F5Z01DRAFT_741967 [Emericellopsis atlantica]